MNGGGCRLLVRKLPNFLRPEDKESLLKFFGAVDVSVMSQNGAMRNCAFATFANPADARMAMIKLHQLNVFGSVLVVVYASPQSEREGSVENRWKGDKVDATDESNLKSPPERKLSSSSMPQLTYEYPPPTQLIISNIANAIAAVPILYTQVLHLMNKLNMPSPFGQPLPVPDLPSGVRESENSESELSSSTDGEADHERMVLSGSRLRRKRRRKMPKRRSISFKQLKESMPLKEERQNDEEATRFSRKIEIRAPNQLQPQAKEDTLVENVYTFAATPVQQEKETIQTGGAPELEPQEEIPLEEDFISFNELQANRISAEEMEHQNGVFKNYNKGEPSMRLYIKNLAKQVTEKDLVRIYGRYINWSSEANRHSFDVRVMQQGRMKGQAFIGMPDEETASRALSETLGYKLYDKPMVVQFARSTKAKEKQAWQT